MYADDTILFFQSTPDACHHISTTLSLYARLAGQDINKNKSKIIFSPNVPRLHKRFLASIIGVSFSPSLGKYLGTTLDHHTKPATVY